jgi:hypothetical protein
MYTTDRRSAMMGILLGALAMLSLSACGKPDDFRTTTRPTTGVPTVVGAEAATSMPNATAVAAAPTAEASATALAPTASGTPGAEPTATSTTSITQTAATSTPLATDTTDPFTGTDDLTDTEDITVTGEVSTTGTLTVTHPVAIAIADYFTVPVMEIITLHADGLGFGEIARAYFLARELAADSNPTNDLTAAQILAMHQGGMGWGPIVASLDLPHSNNGRNLGLIMRQHQEHPGTTVAATPTGADSDDHGRPAVPPGQQKDKDKNHGHGHGHEGGHGKGNGKGGGGKKGK